ncbi:hypothetical protein C8R43DRAFT_958112, partial [Mycena crocata]
MPKLDKTIWNTDTALRTAVEKCLLQLLCRELVVRPMMSTDLHINTNKRCTTTDTQLEGVQAQLVSRGAVLQCLVDVCGEGILACDSLFPVLQSPTGMFPGKVSSDAKFMWAMLNKEKEAETLYPFREQLQKQIDKDKDIPFYASEIARYVHHQTLELQHRHVLSEEEVDNPHALPAEERAPAPRKGGKSLNLKCIPRVQLSPDHLIHNLNTRGPTLFVVPAVIIREALNKMREGKNTSKPIDKSLRRILDGQNPGTGIESRSNLDH